MSLLEVLPELRIEVDGAPLEDACARALAGVTLLQRLSLPALCELTFLEPAGELREAAKLLPGSTLRVTIGALNPLFSGELSGVQHRYGPAREREVRVRAYDLLHRLRKRQPVRTHLQRTLRELAQDLVSDLGLKVRLDDAGPLWPRVMQWHQSDLELLRECAERNGQYFAVRGDELRFSTLEGSDDPIPLAWGDTLLEARFDASSESPCREVAVLGWDPCLAAEHESSATRARLGRSIELDPVPGELASAGKRTLVDEALPSAVQGEALAQSELDRHAAREVVVEGTAAGDPRLQPGVRIEVSGVAAALEGRYVVSAVTHTLDRTLGFRSSFETSPPARSSAERGAVATFGIVIDSADPDRLGRIRVRLPTCGQLETDWLEVAAPAAGKDKGLVALPDSGDRVLLLLPRHDPAQAIVLGGLYGSAGAPDAGVRDGRVKRYTWVTPRGQRIYLDDERREIRIENDGGTRLTLAPGRARISSSGGSFVELTDDLLRVHASTDLEIEAPGKSLVFRGQKVDFQTG